MDFYSANNIASIDLWSVLEANSTVRFLNQARAGRRPVRAWFLEIDPVRDVCMCMCVCLCVHPRGY